MVIECSEINQVANELLIAFQDCNKIKNSDLRTLVNLVLAVNICTNGGVNYNTLVQESYTPLSDQVVSYPVNSFHAVSVMIIDGSITQTISSTIVTFPKGTTLNTEFTTLNQTSYTFTVKAGSTVVVEYLIETII